MSGEEKGGAGDKITRVHCNDSLNLKASSLAKAAADGRAARAAADGRAARAAADEKAAAACRIMSCK
jgi:hypothetical protein